MPKAWLLAAAALSWAAGPLSGTYRCYRHEAGGSDDRCLSAPLVLKDSGRYELAGDTGTYSAAGGKLSLSGSRRFGMGRIIGERVVFEYRENGQIHRVTYLRQAADAGPSAVRVVVSIEGSDGRINTASLVPKGAQLGLERFDSLAWADGPDRVECSFRNVPVGKAYTLYAGTEREMKPIGTVDLRGAKGPVRLTVVAGRDP